MAPFSKKQGSFSNRGEQPVQFRHKDAQRIANVVHQVETARRGRNPSYLPRAAGAGGGGGAVEVTTFTGSWLKYEVKALTLSSDTTESVPVWNFLRSIPAHTASLPRLCIIASASVPEGAAASHVLIEAECP